MKEFKKVKEIVSQFIDLRRTKVYLFGSRVRGTHRHDSDLDILFFDDGLIKPETITKLEEAFEESDLPFKVDIILRSRISDDFYNKIKFDVIELVSI